MSKRHIVGNNMSWLINELSCDRLLEMLTSLLMFCVDHLNGFSPQVNELSRDRLLEMLTSLVMLCVDKL